MKNCGHQFANKENMQKSDSFWPLKSTDFKEIIPKVDAVEILP